MITDPLREEYSTTQAKGQGAPILANRWIQLPTEAIPAPAILLWDSRQGLQEAEGALRQPFCQPLLPLGLRRRTGVRAVAVAQSQAAKVQVQASDVGPAPMRRPSARRCQNLGLWEQRRRQRCPGAQSASLRTPFRPGRVHPARPPHLPLVRAPPTPRAWAERCHGASRPENGAIP